MHGKRIGLPGATNSPESLAEYGRLIREYLREKSQPRRRPQFSITCLSVADLVNEWLTHCKVHYLGTANTSSNEYDNCRYSVRPLMALYAGRLVSQLSTEDLRDVRDVMISGKWESEANKRKPRPWSRPQANASINRIKRMVRWAVEHNRMSVETAGPLLMLSPLEKGRSIAIEHEPVRPVDAATVAATLPYLNPVVRSMVELQQLTGMRPDNICSLKPCEIDRLGKAWIYCPAAHKGTARGRSLSVAIGPKGQAILTPYLDRPDEAYCFSPREAPKSSKRNKDRYTTASYRRSVFYGIKQANKHRNAGTPEIPMWHPHQLRHARAGEIQRHRNLDAARAALGHSAVTTTAIYAERDLALAKEIALEIG
jgi:integrase